MVASLLRQIAKTSKSEEDEAFSLALAGTRTEMLDKLAARYDNDRLISTASRAWYILPI